MKRFASVLLLLCVCSGCSTLNTWRNTKQHLWVYSGTQANIDPFERKRTGPYVPLQRAVAIFDFPFSLVLDTVALPVMLPLELFADKPRPEGLDEAKTDE